MKTTGKWVESSDKAPYLPVKLSGRGGKVPLKGYDANDREIASASGGTVTPALLKRPGKHVPMEKPWTKTPDDYETPLSSNMGEPVEIKKWNKKNYQMIAPATSPAGSKVELSQHDVPKTAAGKRAKMHTVMSEFKSGSLHSGSKKGPKVKSRAQAIAIGLKQSGQSNQ